MTSERLEVTRTIEAAPDAVFRVLCDPQGWSSIHPHWREAGIFPVVSEGALRATLGILARTVARGYIGRRT